MVRPNAQHWRNYEDWDDESAHLDTMIRESGHFTLVDVLNQRIRFFPLKDGKSTLPPMINLQISLNGNALGKMLYHDLVHEAGFKPISDDNDEYSLR